ncbi:UNVERIFIED_CONTAM: hypothetical protein Sangu_2260300 [Sesamum angustifolium]|uniref:MAT1 centre domain-containing protein n=1 Tax=Sesamum angustifolium TaxID=2727405 RepID=A0AAW2L4S2_9LAMI
MVVASGTNAFAKEMAIRKRIAGMCLLAVVNLIEGIDVPAIEARIAQYQRENAEQIMNAQARKQSSTQAGTSGTVAQGQYAPAVAGGGIAQPRPVGMGPQPIPLGSGHDMFEYEDEETMKLRAEKAARAGGWSVEISKKRAIEEAFASIWI